MYDFIYFPRNLERILALEIGKKFFRVVVLFLLVEIRVGQIALIFRSNHPIDQRSMSDDLIEKIFVIWSLIGSIRFSFRSNFGSICAIFCVGNTSHFVFRGMVSWVRKGFLLPKWVKIFSRPFYMVLVITKRNKKLLFAKNAVFFLADCVIWSEFCSKIWSVIGSENLFFWKIGIGA